MATTVEAPAPLAGDDLALERWLRGVTQRQVGEAMSPRVSRQRVVAIEALGLGRVSPELAARVRLAIAAAALIRRFR